MAEIPNGIVRWKAFVGILLALFSVGVAYSKDMHDHMEKMVTRNEFDKSEESRAEFRREYRQDQKSQNELLQKLLEKVSKLDH